MPLAISIYPTATLFFAVLKYLASFSIPITFDAPQSRPASSIVPEPQNGSM